jgi:ParB family chromosome partitioning protein
VRPQPKRVGEKSRYWIKYGERRWRAHQIAGLTEIRATVEVMADTDAARDKLLIAQLVENMAGLRAEVSPIEEAEAMKRLLDAGWSADKIARELGVAKFRVEQKLDILRCVGEVRDLIKAGSLSVYHATELAKLEPIDQSIMLTRIKRGQLKTMPEIRTAVQAILDNKNQGDMLEGAPDAPKATDDEVETVNRMEKRIESVAGMIGSGWKDGECVVARKVSPDRLTAMADKLKEMRSALVIMEKELRTAAVQAELGAVKEKPKGKTNGKAKGSGSKTAAAPKKKAA